MNDFKKLFFGAESLAKSAAEKASDKGKEASEQFSKKTEEYVEKAKETVEDVGEDILKKADEFWKRTQEVAEEIGEEVLKRSKPYADKAKEFIKEREKDFRQETHQTTQQHSTTPPPPPPPKTAEKDWASEIVNEAFTEPNDITKQAASQVKDSQEEWDDLLTNAHKVSEKLEQKVADKKSQDTSEKEPTPATGTSQKIGYDNLKGSLLDGQDDFFAKAQRYAEGDYHNTGRKPGEEEPKEGEIKITKNPDFKKEEPTGTVYGFEDLDGDGNELIDDAIIIKDDDE